MAQHASAAVKMAALALAAPALLLQMKAAGQQMALGGPTVASECDALSTAGARIECANRLQTEENRRAAADASKRADSGEDRLACANEIKAGVGAGTFKAERLKEVLAGRPAKEVDLCKVLAQLKS